MGHVNESRQIFDRMVSIKTNVKNMKSIFKKYLNFELEHGNIETQNNVKQKAKEYVVSLSAGDQ